MLNTEAVTQDLGITRSKLNYRCLVHRIKPRQKIVNGRVHNTYAVKDVERLRGILRTKFK